MKKSPVTFTSLTDSGPAYAGGHRRPGKYRDLSLQIEANSVSQHVDNRTCASHERLSLVVFQNEIWTLYSFVI